MANKNRLPESPKVLKKAMPEVAQTEDTSVNIGEVSVTIDPFEDMNDTPLKVPNEADQDTTEIKTSIGSSDKVETSASKQVEVVPVNAKSGSSKAKGKSAIVDGSNPPAMEEKNIYVQTSDFIFLRYRIRLNSFTQQIEGTEIKENKYRPITDRLVNTLVYLCNKNKIHTNKTIMWTILNTTQNTPEFNPLREYLDGLPEWKDGTDYIGMIAERVQVDGTPKWKEWFTRYFVAMVASGLHDDVHNEMMLIFYGKQSVGKTTFLRNLIPPQLQKFYYSVLLIQQMKNSLVI